MQLTSSPAAEKIPAIRKALQEQRIDRYLTAAGSSSELAFRLYMWNWDLSEAFQLPLHIAEVTCRNAIHRCLLARRGERWFEDATLRKLLDGKCLAELDAAIAEEHDQHKDGMTCHHVVSCLSFGFWEHLTTKRFERLLWSRGIHHSFPNAHHSLKYGDLQRKIETVRRWRNRIAHHKAIFHKDPTAKYQEAIELIEWVCADTAHWVKSVSRVSQVINLRPH